MKTRLLFITLILFLVSCNLPKHSAVPNYGSPNIKTELLDSETFKIDIYSDDKDYGYTEAKPIMVGGSSDSQGPLNERRFLNALRGPNGEKITYQRLGSCCPFSTKRGFDGRGFLDKYEINYDGLEKPIILYLNMYDSDVLKIPVGFKKKDIILAI